MSKAQKIEAQIAAMRPDYSLIPVDYMVEGTRLYIEEGIAPGHFLTAVIENDLKNTLGYADETNRLHVREWVSWFYNQAPSECWGSPQKMQAWMELGGLRGYAERHTA